MVSAGAYELVNTSKFIIKVVTVFTVVCCYCLACRTALLHAV
jgi:hypothetical protein